MKLVHPFIERQIVFAEGIVNVIVVENQSFYYQLLEELLQSYNEQNERFILSSAGKILKLKDWMDIVSDPFHLDFEQKRIIGKIKNWLIEIGQDETHYAETATLLSQVSGYIAGLADELDAEIGCLETEAYQLEALIKGAAVRLQAEGKTLPEKLIDYMMLLRSILGVEIFCFFNIKTFLSEENLTLFYSMAEQRKLHLLLFENRERKEAHVCEKIIFIDEDLCEF